MSSPGRYSIWRPSSFCPVDLLWYRVTAYFHPSPPHPHQQNGGGKRAQLSLRCDLGVACVTLRPERVSACPVVREPETWSLSWCPCAQVKLRGSVTKGRRESGRGGQPAESACPLIRCLLSLPTPDIIHKFIRDKYSKRFPELESLVPNALDYIRTVKVSGRGGGLGRTEVSRQPPV